MKQRAQRFGGDDLEEDEEKLQNKIHRMETKLKWIEHKAPPLPIQAKSTITTDSLYLFGVDFMSTGDVLKYFKRYLNQEEPEEDQKKRVVWINDSSCLVKFESSDHSLKAYEQLKLSEPRDDDELPSLKTYLQEKQQIEKEDQAKKEHNPDYEDLFGGGDIKPQDEEVKKPENAE